MDVTDNEDGTYSAVYNVSAAGTYSLSILLDDDHHILGSPFHVDVTPGEVEAARCTAAGDGAAVATPGEAAYLTIEARDAFGNKLANGGHPFEVALVGPARLRALQDQGDGTYGCAYEVAGSAAGYATDGALVQISVTMSGVPIQGSPFAPVLRPKGADDPPLAPDLAAMTRAAMPDRPLPPPPPPPPQAPPAAEEAPVSPGAGSGGGGPNPDKVRAALRRKQQSLQKSLDDVDAARADVEGGADEATTRGRSSTEAVAAAYSAVDRLVGAASVAVRHSTPGGRGGGSDAGAGSPAAASSPNPAAPNPNANANPPRSPGGVDDETARLWRIVLANDKDKAVGALLDQHAAALAKVFKFYGTYPKAAYGSRCLTLGAKSETRGLLPLTADFDISPTFLSRREGALCYAAVKKNSPEGRVTAGAFTQLLGLLAVVALSKPSFAALYTTNRDKVAVLLERWGLADPFKFDAIRHRKLA